MCACIDKFYCKRLYMHNSAPAEVLDCFLCGLQPSVCTQVLFANPSTFARAALLAEYIVGAHGEAAHNGPQPMDLGAVQGSSMGVTSHGARQGNGTHTGQGQGEQSG